MDFPLESIHPFAFKAAEAAGCAGDQGKFWEMHDLIFADQKAMGEEDLIKRAEKLGLEMARFRECLKSGKHSAQVRKDIGEAQRVRVNSVPSFLLGYVEPGGKVRAVKMLTGAQPYAAFKEAIENLPPARK